MIGTLFAGDYEVLAPLAQGGMGALYSVRQRSTGKMRALKVMLPEIVADPEARRRFEQEAKVASRIASEHVVEVIDAGIFEGTPFLVMEHLRGFDLAKRLESPMSLAETRAIFEQLCHALGAAHRAGVVHRDLKPENVFLAESQRAGSSWEVKVLDFGIAKIAAESKSSTRASGTPLWMAPEQTQPGHITPAADVWALGLIAFTMLSGKNFWKCMEQATPSIIQLLQEVLHDPIPPASARGSVPPGFDAVFARCVARDPTMRFQNAGELWTALAPLLSDVRVAVPVPPLKPKTSAAVPILVLAAFVIPIVGAGASLVWLKTRESAPVPTASTTSLPPPTKEPVHGVTKRTAFRSLGSHFDPDELSISLDRGLKRWSSCYDDALIDDPKLRGGVVLHVTIDAQSRVIAVANELPDGGDMKASTDLPNKNAVSCLIAETRRISFPPPDIEAAHIWIALSFEPQ